MVKEKSFVLAAVQVRIEGWRIDDGEDEGEARESGGYTDHYDRLTPDEVSLLKS